MVSDLEEKHGGKIDVVVINVYENMEQAQEYEIRVVPTIVLLDGEGEILERVEGYMTLEAIEQMLEKHQIL